MVSVTQHAKNLKYYSITALYFSFYYIKIHLTNSVVILAVDFPHFFAVIVILFTHLSHRPLKGHRSMWHAKF